MFTGLIEELGRVIQVTPGSESTTIRIRGPLAVSDAKVGDSIAVNGVCLTVLELDDETFSVFIMAESLARSSLGQLVVGSQVNLERAMPANGRFGGHIVQGHVDGVGTITSRMPGDRWETVGIEVPVGLRRYIVEKGSITVDGVSLTVASVTDDGIQIGLIPATLVATSLGQKQVGDQVNLEVDVLAKYVERLIGQGE